MNQCRGLQCLSRLLIGNFPCRQLSKVVINKRQELISSVLITLFNVGQNTRQVAHFGVNSTYILSKKQSNRSRQEATRLDV